MTEISGGIGRKIVGKGRVRKDGGESGLHRQNFVISFQTGTAAFLQLSDQFLGELVNHRFSPPQLVVNHSGLDPCPGVISQMEKGEK